MSMYGDGSINEGMGSSYSGDEEKVVGGHQVVWWRHHLTSPGNTWSFYSVFPFSWPVFWGVTFTGNQLPAPSSSNWVATFLSCTDPGETSLTMGTFPLLGSSASPAFSSSVLICLWTSHLTLEPPLVLCRYGFDSPSPAEGRPRGEGWWRSHLRSGRIIMMEVGCYDWEVRGGETVICLDHESEWLECCIMCTWSVDLVVMISKIRKLSYIMVCEL